MVKIAVCDDEKELREMTAAWLRDYFAPQEVLLSLYDGGEALLRAGREEDCRFQLAVLLTGDPSRQTFRVNIILAVPVHLQHLTLLPRRKRLIGKPIQD